jgi:predicted nucleic acid-binding protein
MGWDGRGIKMARPALVLDASVGVKWFSPKDEAALKKALSLRNAHISQQILVRVPDLFYYEVTNAVTNKKSFSNQMVQSVVSSLFSLNLQTIAVNTELLCAAANISRQFNITIYDSCYIAIAAGHNCPLVTANPRHHKQDMGCQVISIEQWKL